MRRTWGSIICVAAIVGCVQVDENPDWNPRADYPSWTYDAPWYYRPTEELKALETVCDGVPVYYASGEYFFIRHPSGSQLPGVPRVSVWCSIDDGQDWHRAGFYGTEQTHFLMKAEREGQHWIRFVGPGQGVTPCPPGVPHRVYVVDNHGPDVVVSVAPGPWEVDLQGGKRRRVYQIGQTVTVKWHVSDPNLDESSVRLGTCFAQFPCNLEWSRIPQALPPNGCLDMVIPEQAAGGGGIRFRVEAADKAGNISVGVTEVLYVGGAATMPAALASRQVDAIDRLEMMSSSAEGKLGWPQAGCLLRGGTPRILAWMPKLVEAYDSTELQFTHNDGRTWKTIATSLRPGKAVNWTVPLVNSRNCRLRIVSVKRTDTKELVTMLAMTRRFTVDTIVPGTFIGPKKEQF